MPNSPEHLKRIGFKKGRSGNPGGRPKGSHNIFTHQIRNVIIKAYKKLGGDDAFVDWCNKHKDIFYREAWIRLLPRDLTIDGEIDTKVTFKIIRFGEDLKQIGNNIPEQLETKALPAPIMDVS